MPGSIARSPTATRTASQGEHMGIDPSQRAAELFKAALARDPGDRAAFLSQACRGDETLRAEVEALLAADAQADGFLDPPHPRVPQPGTSDGAPDSLIGRKVGQYRIVGLIASGGMGTVYEAQQDRPRRRVALKLLRSGLASRSALRRFGHEAEILARLRHPGIAQVYEAGSHGEDGETPYFAMEYIPGAQSITEYAGNHRLSTRQRLELFLTVCEAVHHGHQRGVIHRDLKPGNILVDESGQPKVIDFGVARATDADMTIATLQTDVGQLVGTLRYMSPEQCEGDAIEIDTRSDVYALGVVLFELLTGELPYDLTTTSPFEVPRVIREAEPRRLSTVNRALRGDIETIVLKALAKERDRRYQSALELGQDIRHYLKQEPIQAKRDRTWYVFIKTVSRHRATVAVLCVIALLVTGSAVGFGLLYRRADRQRAVAEERSEELRRAAYFNGITMASKALEDEDTATAARVLDECPADLRAWEWHYLRRQADNSLLTLRGHTAWVHGIGYSPDGGRIASAGWMDGSVRLWDAATGRELRVFAKDEKPVGGVAFAPDGSTLAWHQNAAVRLCDAATGENTQVIRTECEYASVAFSPDGRLLAFLDNLTRIRLWDVEARRETRVLEGHSRRIHAIVWSPDGRRIASAGEDRTVRIWDVVSGENMLTLTGHPEFVWHLAFSPDGATLASVGVTPENTIRFWNSSTAEPLRACGFGTRRTDAIAYSPDGRRFAASVGLVIKIWDVETWKEQTSLTGLHSSAQNLVFSPDGERIAAGAISGEIKVWDGNPQQEPSTLWGHTDELRDVVVASDGRRIYSASTDGTIRVWDVSSRQETASWVAHQERVCTLSVNADGSRLASGGRDHMLRIWDTASGRMLHECQAFEDWNTGAVAFSPDGRRVASGGKEGVIKLWNADTGELLRVMPGRPESVGRLEFSPDGRQLLSSGIDASVWIWELDTGAAVRELSGHVGSLWSVVNAVFSPDGGLIATADGTQTVRIWQATTGTLLHELPGHFRPVGGLAFSPDGRRLATGDAAHLVRLWDVNSGKLVLTLRGHEGIVSAISFAPDGRWFVTASHDRTLRIWDARAPVD